MGGKQRTEKEKGRQPNQRCAIKKGTTLGASVQHIPQKHPTWNVEELMYLYINFHHSLIQGCSRGRTNSQNLYTSSALLWQLEKTHGEKCRHCQVEGRLAHHEMSEKIWVRHPTVICYNNEPTSHPTNENMSISTAHNCFPSISHLAASSTKSNNSSQIMMPLLL